MARHPRHEAEDDEPTGRAALADGEKTGRIPPANPDTLPSVPKAPPEAEHRKTTEPAKVMVTWLGEGDAGPRSNVWNGQTFKVGEAVEITDPHMIAKAKTNRFYKVTEA